MTTSTTRRRNARGEGSRLREDIVQAAIALIDGSPRATPLTLRGVARETGVSAPSIYAHFTDLAALEEAVLAESFRELEASVRSAIEGAADPALALHAAGLAYVRFGWEHPDRYRRMFSASGYAPDAVSVFDVVERMITASVAAGQSTSDDPHGDAFLLWVGMHGMATLEKPARTDYLRLGPLDRAASVGVLISRLARLTTPPPPSSPASLPAR
jgi:AcrR family transcriptional regulator